MGHGSEWYRPIRRTFNPELLCRKQEMGQNRTYAGGSATQRAELTLTYPSLNFSFSDDDDSLPGLSSRGRHCTHTGQRHRNS